MAALWSVFEEIEPSDIAKSSGDEETSLTAYRISEDDLISDIWQVTKPSHAIICERGELWCGDHKLFCFKRRTCRFNFFYFLMVFGS
ncbi:hypothetical protein HanPI659440_Chr13g0482441 [Helianthus annuus]|nr:hypothetical protein HanPI659440_Chr13g0482441 [Helianthus annuus]